MSNQMYSDHLNTHHVIRFPRTSQHGYVSTPAISASSLGSDAESQSPPPSEKYVHKQKLHAQMPYARTKSAHSLLSTFHKRTKNQRKPKRRAKKESHKKSHKG